MNGSFTVSPDNTLTGNISNSFYGDSSYRWRSALINLETKKKRDYVQDWLSNFVPNFTLASYDTSNLTTYNKDLQVKINFSAANYARAIGPMLLVRPCVVGKVIYRLDTKPRKYPINMGEPRTVTSDFTIQLPDGYKVDDIPDAVKVDTGFASYESKTVVQGNTVHYTRTFVERAVELPPEKYEDLKHLMEIINNDERSEVVLKKSS